MPAAWIGGVLAAGLGLSIAASAVLRQGERREWAERRAAMAREEIETLHVSILRSMEVLYSLESLHRVEGRLDRAVFASFVAAALRRQPELLALSWNPRVAAGDRGGFEADTRRGGAAGYGILEQTADGALTPAEGREAYVPVQWIEPAAENAGVMGYDLASDPVRRRALEEARDTGEPRATEPIRLAQLSGEETGFLVVLPVYRESPAGRGALAEAGATVAQRREQLAGYAVAVFQVAALVESSFRSLQVKGLTARLLDGTREGPVIYGPGMAFDPSGYEAFEVAGRQWVLAYGIAPGGTAAARLSESWLVLLGGIAFTGLSTVYVVGGWRRTRLIARANQSLEEEVRTRQRAEAAAAAANRAKSDFLASMSHEIRTPLNAILGYAQLLRRDRTLADEQRDCVDGIHTGGQHLLGLINEILDLSKIEAGRMDLNPTDLDLGALVSGLATTFRPLCAEKRLGFRYALENTPATRVRGDEGKLRQVLINLIGNAVKFTSAGEVYLGVRGGAGDRWAFEVIDTGAGIPAEEHPEIFKPFHQGRGAGHAGGTGLGLAIAQRQVELMGGRLEVQSERGIGSRFHFTLELPAVAGVPASAAVRPTRLAPGQEVTALVVDDQWGSRDVVRRMLESAGCRVEIARDAAEALDRVRDRVPDVVFLDLLLPDRSGFDWIVDLRRNPCGAVLPVVMMTASALPEHRVMADALGCVEFLGKPVQFEAVVDVLGRHLGKRLVEEAEVASPGGGRHGSFPIVPVRLPASLHGRLTLAAELHSMTALRAALQELRECGPAACGLAEHLRERMRCFDMAGIQRALQTHVQPEAEAAPPPSPHGILPSPRVA